MNKKQLLLVIVLGLVIGAAGLYQYQRRQAPSKDSRMGAKLLGDFDVNTVAGLRLQSASNEVHVLKSGDIWTVQERAGYPANFSTIADFVRKLADLKVVKPVRVAASRLPMLELVAPDKKGPGVLVELRDAAGKPVRSLLLGAKHMREGRGGGPMGDTGWPDGRYIMVDGKADNIALVSDALTQAEPKPEDWISKDFIKVEKLKAVNVTASVATNNWNLARDTENGEWKLADAKGDEKADASKCSGLNYLLQSASFNDVATAWSFGETNKPSCTAALATFEGFTYAVKLAPKPGSEDYYLQVAIGADLPKERTPGKDEKPEDKEKLDKEFKEKNQKLQDKLKTEKPYEKWTYIVSKWTVDNLLKERKEFLAEKKEEPKKEEPKKEEKK
jgi:hypothetical protein